MARDAALVGGLAVWVVLCAFVQHASATFGYSGFVAAFSAGILLFGTSCSIGAERCAGGSGGGGAGSLLEDVALERIEMTLQMPAYDGDLAQTWPTKAATPLPSHAGAD